MKTIEIKSYKDIPYKYTGIVKHVNGDKYWFLNGILHRKDGPAVTNPDLGYEEYRIHGKLHREAGPAISFPGDEAWFLNGKKLNKDKIEQLIDLGYPVKAAIRLISIV